MSIASGLSIANSGLAAIEAQLAVVSQNVANANTAGYSAESVSLTATSAQGLGTGVKANPAIQQVSTSIQAQLNASVADQSFQQTTSAALTGIDQVMGTPGQGNDLSSLLGNLQSGFTTLLSDPGNTVQQAAVVGTAQDLSNQINTIAGALGSAVTTARGNVVAGVKSLNASLAQVGTLNDQIISLAQQGKSTADLQNQRDALVQTIAGLTGAKSIAQPTGAIALYTPSGLQLPTSGTPKLTVSGTGAVMLGTQNVTSSITTGSIGANLQLASSTLPNLESGLDNLASTVANSFAAAGLTLFTTPSGTTPTSATGFAGQITVNPNVTTNPALIRDGTPATANTSGDAGFTGLIGTILSTTLNGGTGTLATMTTGFTAQEASVSSAAQTASTAANSLTTALTTQASTTSGVSVDQQMGLLVTLQNAYAANAKVVSIAQQMWQTQESMIS
jgi:flagellar hook-associated protein 1 FlgK